MGYFMTTLTRDNISRALRRNQPNFSDKVNREATINTLLDHTGFKILSLTDSKKGNVSGFTDFQFSNTTDISSCLSVEAMDTPTLNMDSLDFYCFKADEKKSTSKVPTSPEDTNNLFDLALADLDPEVEQSFDITDLLEKHDEVGEGRLFPELPQEDLRQEGGNTLTARDTREDGHMPHQIIKVEFPESSATNVLTISPEDLASVTQALDGPVILDITTPRGGFNTEEAPDEIELQRPDSPYSTYSECVSEAPSTTDYSTIVPTPRRRGPKPKGQVKSVSQPKSRRRVPPKDTDEYKERRARNNVAVRKSRDKAKLRQSETEGKVQELVQQNEKLQKKCDLLTKELNVLKGLFTNVGASLPPALIRYLDKQ